MSVVGLTTSIPCSGCAAWLGVSTGGLSDYSRIGVSGEEAECRFVAALDDGMPAMPPVSVPGSRFLVTACRDGVQDCLWT